MAKEREALSKVHSKANKGLRKSASANLKGGRSREASDGYPRGRTLKDVGTAALATQRIRRSGRARGSHRSPYSARTSGSGSAGLRPSEPRPECVVGPSLTLEFQILSDPVLSKLLLSRSSC